MKGHKALVRRILEQVKRVEKDIVRQPLLELWGDRRLLIENHGGVLEYGLEKIQVKVSYGVVCICGEHLRLCTMSDQQLVIQGRIHSIQLMRRVCR